MRFDYIQRRLADLEQRIVSREGPWPPEPGSFSYLLWDALGRPEKRLSYMDMYMESARRFWEDQK